ncbi:hypothetical protein E4P34_03525 [Kocuria rhizophila]|uniref:Abortive phage infection protein C-terminal domain-containing protein n=1 Tax=Kocuria rhizophila TaxID=72000 RepID=A0AAX2SEJ8_KOCRH|nr:AIPR family protein [Kocuria rhizophila]TFI01327.1 hypothetical protein E4P33_07155 [Kocuria rhizophila]TFI09571.1 hypothetical protein E4P34_03525 [Kocuria rhizophila]WSQ06040.1 AIPR family protein [Kocuria rhizophila]
MENENTPPAEYEIDAPAWQALSQRTDLFSYGYGNAIAIFVAQLRMGIEDAETFAADAVTDGGNDKKCDLVFVNRERETLVIAQAYANSKPKRANSGPANKASDLNTAVSWVLSGPLDSLPGNLKPAAAEARALINEGRVNSLEIWSVHNCPESKNIQTELDQVANTANNILSSEAYTDGHAQISSIRAIEYGVNTINNLYLGTRTPISVTKSFVFNIEGGYETKGDAWTAYNTSIRLSELRNLWAEYQTELLAPNIREYLGVRQSKSNINFGIKNTARNTPKDFYIFNNGITAMVNGFTPATDGKSVEINGIGIVNGGQTTGSIGTLSKNDSLGLSEAFVQIRFVSSTDHNIFEQVVRFNNTQNKIEAKDFRSNDPIQERLRTEFESIPNAQYKGARRGGSVNAIRRDRATLSDNSVAQSLASFHGDPNAAYNELRTIWDSDHVYSKYFNDKLTARHVVFCYSLLKSVEAAKQSVVSIPPGDRTKTVESRAEFFRSRGSVHLLTGAIGSCVDTLLDFAVVDSFKLNFGATSPEDAKLLWDPVVDFCMRAVGKLEPATDRGMRSNEVVRDAYKEFEMMIDMTKEYAWDSFEQFRENVINK